jgi:UDP-N-acetylglucosamine transferase subunit ALG13
MPETTASSLRILISPLNWGLGHACRVIPLIRNYGSRGHHIIMGGNGYSLELLKLEFPELETVFIPFTSITYSRGRNHFFFFISGFARFCLSLIQEHRRLKSLVKEKNIDIVISDNRLGLFCTDAHCIILTHQVWLRMPKGWSLLEFFANHFNHYLIRRFDECWIIDNDEATNLAGELSHPALTGLPVKYIGPISRFGGIKPRPTSEIGVLVILGGPEPQRSILEEILIKQLSETDISSVIAGGTPNGKPHVLNANLSYFPFADGNKLAELIQSAEIIICRSGYSSVMDLMALKRSAILIPTPGQPEQEYLGDYLSAKRYFLTYRQSEFDLKQAINEWKSFQPLTPDIKFNQFPLE